MSSPKWWFAVSLALSMWTAVPAPAAPEKAADPDEAALKEAKIATYDDALLAFLRRRSGNDKDLRDLENLVRRLGSAEFTEREEASKRLVALGWAALSRLREARAD